MKYRGTFNPEKPILWTPPLSYYDLKTLIVDRRLLVVITAANVCARISFLSELQQR